jgi:protein SCO1/2
MTQLLLVLLLVLLAKPALLYGIEANYTSSRQHYRIPDVTLIDSADREVSLVDELAGDSPVMLNFIFTSCAAVCPVLSATFAEVQQQLASAQDKPRLISITIDPEYDTPGRLLDYAQKYGADPDWRFLTGDLDTIIAVQKAFAAYRGDKMSHLPLTLVRAGGSDWVRIEGFTSAADLLREYRALVVQP